MERLFDTEAAGLYKYFSRRAGVAADDLVSETFVAALTSIASFDSEKGQLRSWLYGIATNILRRHIRQETSRLLNSAKISLSEMAHEDPADVVADRVDAARQVGELAFDLAQMNSDDRDVLLLTAWAGLSTIEVAEALGIPEGTVRSRLHRVRKKLRMIGHRR